MDGRRSGQDCAPIRDSAVCDSVGLHEHGTADERHVSQGRRPSAGNDCHKNLQAVLRSFLRVGPAAIQTVHLGLASVAYFVDPTIATDVRDRWLDIDTTLGPDYGKVKGYFTNLPTGLLHKTSIVFHIDKDRFLKFYVDLLTRPVPVKFQDGGGGDDDGGDD